MTRVWIINQTGTKLAPFGPSKYSQLARHLHNDPDIEIVNPRELVHQPEQLPYFKRDATLFDAFHSHTLHIDDAPQELNDPYFHSHFQYFRAVYELARRAEAIPLVLADPHEFTLAPAVVLAEHFPDLQIPIADAHIDFFNNSFCASGFFRYAISKKLLNPRSLQLFGPGESLYRNLQGETRWVVITDELISCLPPELLRFICADRDTDLPERETSEVLEFMTLTDRLTMPDGWDERRLLAELETTDGVDGFLSKMLIIQARIYLRKVGAWLDLDQPEPVFDYQGKPVFFSLDTDVSSVPFPMRNPPKVLRDLRASVKTGRLVGLHVAEAETPLNRWSAENIYQIIRNVLVN